MADSDQQLVDGLNGIRADIRGLVRRLEGTIANRRAEPDKRYADAMRALAADIAVSARSIEAAAGKIFRDP